MFVDKNLKPDPINQGFVLGWALLEEALGI